MRLEESLLYAAGKSQEAKRFKLAKKARNTTPEGLLAHISSELIKNDMFNASTLSIKTKASFLRFIRECEYVAIEPQDVLTTAIRHWRSIGEYIEMLLGYRIRTYDIDMFDFSMFYYYRGHILDLITTNKNEVFSARSPLSILGSVAINGSPANILDNRCPTKHGYVHITHYQKFKEVTVSESTIQFIAPWNISGFKGSRDDLLEVNDMLDRRGYKVKRYLEYPGDDIASRVKQVLNALITEKWVLLVGNNSIINTELSYLIPICYALTYSLTVKNVDNATLGEAFERWDPDDEAFNEAKRARLLVYDNIQDCNKEISDFKGSLNKFMRHRNKNMSENLLIMFTTTPVVEKALASQFEKMGYYLGSFFIDIVTKKALILDMSTPATPLRIAKA
jgi:hypothetical protein